MIRPCCPCDHMYRSLFTLQILVLGRYVTKYLLCMVFLCRKMDFCAENIELENICTIKVYTKIIFTWVLAPQIRKFRVKNWRNQG